MKKLSIGESAFGACRRLDEAYLNQVLQDDGYVELESAHSAVASANGSAAPQGSNETTAYLPLELLKAIRHVNFRSLHRLLSFPLTEMISTAPPDLNGTLIEMAREKSKAKSTAGFSIRTLSLDFSSLRPS